MSSALQSPSTSSGVAEVRFSPPNLQAVVRQRKSASHTKREDDRPHKPKSENLWQ